MGLLKPMPPDSKFNQVQLRAGTKVEMEHTRYKSTAKQIAKAHLQESPEYYKELKKMEQRLEKKKRGRGAR
jgi:hypothetical protein